VSVNVFQFLFPQRSFFSNSHSDNKNRQHILSLKFPTDYSSTPEYSADLPVSLESFKSLSSNASVGASNSPTLGECVAKFRDILTLFEPFWNEMDDLDSNSWVIEPEQHSFSITTRRIVLPNRCSLQLQIDPRRPRAIPECKLIGADAVVGPLRDCFSRNLHQWNSLDLSLRSNLERLFELDKSGGFPLRSSAKQDEVALECGICYIFRLENTIPDRACENAKCGKTFHRTCLFEWLRAIPTSRQSFNTIFGQCPYCSESINAKAD
jgi:E3 ubiquitin-protein ligase FANCL